MNNLRKKILSFFLLFPVLSFPAERPAPGRVSRPALVCAGLAWGGLAAQLSNNPVVKKAGAVAGVLGGLGLTCELFDLTSRQDWLRNRLQILEWKKPEVPQVKVNLKALLANATFQQLINNHVDQAVQSRFEQKENEFLAALPENVAKLLNNPDFNLKLAELIAQQMPAEHEKSVAILKKALQKHAAQGCKQLIEEEKKRFAADRKNLADFISHSTIYQLLMAHTKAIAAQTYQEEHAEHLAQIQKMTSGLSRVCSNHHRSLSSLLGTPLGNPCAAEAADDEQKVDQPAHASASAKTVAVTPPDPFELSADLQAGQTGP